MGTVNLIVTIDEKHIERVEKIAERLTTVGMSVSHTMPTLGMISGTADHDLLETLLEIEGVSDIRDDRGFVLPPNDDLTPQ